MRKTLECLLAFVVFGLFIASCGKAPDPENGAAATHPLDVLDPSSVDSYYSLASISVPLGVDRVFAEYNSIDGKKIVPVDVTPELKVSTGGRNPEPFGTVNLMFTSEEPAIVTVYYQASDGTHSENVYTLTDFPVGKVTFGEFGKTRYVQVPWDFAWTVSEETSWQAVRSYPSDVVFYDSEHNHTLRYRFAYTGISGEGYFLDEAYSIEDHEVKAVKYNYCDGGCGNCPRCMPWGCDCGCGSSNPDFKASGDLTGGGQTVLPDVPADVVQVPLPDPEPYRTQDGGFTQLHSSGVVMFDDSWPSIPQDRGTGAYDYDFNDCVIDYDIEARIVPDNLLESQGWREQLKLVLHVRAVGGDKVERAGVILEGFDQQWISSVETHKTLDSYQNPHGTLPEWTKTTLQENSLHYETVPSRPLSEIGALFRLRESRAGDPAGEYTYSNGSFSHQTVFNPALKLYEPWGGPHTDQYMPELEAVSSPATLSKMQSCVYYNTVPGYVNQAGGLYTYTIIYHMKPRSRMSAEDSRLALENLRNAVINTEAQNFYIVAKSGRITIDGVQRDNYVPIGLKGYAPADFAVKGFPGGYRQFYDANVEQNGGDLDPSVTYAAKDGRVWAFKCPVLTKHVWERMYFADAYPHYSEWVQSSGAEYGDWYKKDVNRLYLSCDW